MSPPSEILHFRVTPDVADELRRIAGNTDVTLSDLIRAFCEVGVALSAGAAISPHVCELMTDGTGVASLATLIVDSEEDAAAALERLAPFGWDQSDASRRRLASGALHLVSMEEARAVVATGRVLA